MATDSLRNIYAIRAIRTTLTREHGQDPGLAVAREVLSAVRKSDGEPLARPKR